MDLQYYRNTSAQRVSAYEGRKHTDVAIQTLGVGTRAKDFSLPYALLDSEVTPVTLGPHPRRSNVLPLPYVCAVSRGNMGYESRHSQFSTEAAKLHCTL